MKHFLIVYDRTAGRLLSCEEFDDRQAALAERFRIERRADCSNLEVVVLGGDSLEAIMRTHGRYFYTIRQLAERAMAELQS